MIGGTKLRAFICFYFFAIVISDCVPITEVYFPQSTGNGGGGNFSCYWNLTSIPPNESSIFPVVPHAAYHDLEVESVSNFAPARNWISPFPFENKQGTRVHEDKGGNYTYQTQFNLDQHSDYKCLYLPLQYSANNALVEIRLNGLIVFSSSDVSCSISPSTCNTIFYKQYYGLNISGNFASFNTLEFIVNNYVDTPTNLLVDFFNITGCHCPTNEYNVGSGPCIPCGIGRYSRPGSGSCSDTQEPTLSPSFSPSTQPSPFPSECPSAFPSRRPSLLPSLEPSPEPSDTPSALPTSLPSIQISVMPTSLPTSPLSFEPSTEPSALPSTSPSPLPTTAARTATPSYGSSECPSHVPSLFSSHQLSAEPSVTPSAFPTVLPTTSPSKAPSITPSAIPTTLPAAQPSKEPSLTPSATLTLLPTTQSSVASSIAPSLTPSAHPTAQPSTKSSTSPSFMPSTVSTTRPPIQLSNGKSDTPTVLPIIQYTTQMPSGGPLAPITATPSAAPNPVSSALPSLSPSALCSAAALQLRSVASYAAYLVLQQTLFVDNVTVSLVLPSILEAYTCVLSNAFVTSGSSPAPVQSQGMLYSSDQQQLFLSVLFELPSDYSCADLQSGYQVVSSQVSETVSSGAVSSVAIQYCVNNGNCTTQASLSLSAPLTRGPYTLGSPNPCILSPSFGPSGTVLNSSSSEQLSDTIVYYIVAAVVVLLLLLLLCCWFRVGKFLRTRKELSEKRLAEWMNNGYSDIDINKLNYARHHTLDETYNRNGHDSVSSQGDAEHIVLQNYHNSLKLQSNRASPSTHASPSTRSSPPARFPSTRVSPSILVTSSTRASPTLTGGYNRHNSVNVLSQVEDIYDLDLTANNSGQMRLDALSRIKKSVMGAIDESLDS